MLFIYWIICGCEIQVIIDWIVKCTFSTHTIGRVRDICKFLPIEYNARRNEHGDCKEGSDDSTENVSHWPLFERNWQVGNWSYLFVVVIGVNFIMLVHLFRSMGCLSILYLLIYLEFKLNKKYCNTTFQIPVTS